MKKILFLLLFLISISASASKVYIATAANGGNNGNAGTLVSPWLTLEYACTQAVAGDTIMVGVGTFSEAACTLPDSVSIYGAGATSIITAATGITIITASASSGDAIDGNQSISYIKFDGDLTALRAIRANFRSNVHVHHCTFVDFLYQALWFTGTVEADFHDEPTNVISVGIKVTNNTFTNNTQYTGNSDAGHIVVQGIEDLDISYNTFDQTGRAAGDNATILNGYQYYNTKIHHNTFTKPDNNAAAWNFFVEMHYCHGGLEVYGNTFNGAANYDLSGVEKGAYAFGAKMYDNIFITAALTPNIGHAEPAIALESFDVEQDVYIYRNYFKNTKTCIAVGNCVNGTDGIWIYDNVMETIGNSSDNWTFGVILNSSYGSDPVQTNNVYIFNNVITTGVASFGGVGFGARGNMTNIEIINNIIRGTFARPVYVLLTGGTPIIDQLNINNNIFYECSSNVIQYAAGITYNNRNTTGNLVADPLFIGGTPYSYKLQSTSPARDAGIDVGLSYDYEGKAIKGLPDIGAYEYQSFSTPSGLGWEPKYFKERLRDTLNIEGGWMIKNEPIVTSARTLNKLDGLVGTAPQINHVTDHFVAGDTTVTAIVGRIVYQSADSSFYGCRSTVAPRKWYKLHD